MTLCGQAITDRNSNNLSLIHVIEQFQLPPAAFVAPGADPIIRKVAQSAYLVATVSWTWPTESGAHTAGVMVQTRTAGGKVVRAQETQGQMSRDGYKRTRLIMELGGIPLDVPGTYELELLVDGTSVGAYPLDVEMAPAEGAGAPTAPSSRSTPRPKPKGASLRGNHAKRRNKGTGS